MRSISVLRRHRLAVAALCVALLGADRPIHSLLGRECGPFAVASHIDCSMRLAEFFLHLYRCWTWQTTRIINRECRATTWTNVNHPMHGRHVRASCTSLLNSWLHLSLGSSYLCLKFLHIIIWHENGDQFKPRPFRSHVLLYLQFLASKSQTGSMHSKCMALCCLRCSWVALKKIVSDNVRGVRRIGIGS